MIKDKIDFYNEKFKNSDLNEVIEYFFNTYNKKIALASSLGAEDQVLTDVIAKKAKEPKVFTLDTGRLPYETYDLLDYMTQKYSFKIDIFFPKSDEVQEMVKNDGINLFYTSVDLRKKCCYIRKIEPLKRALSGLDIWITGLRREQSITREDMKLVEWDDANNLVKINPLINWSENDVWDYIKNNSVPYNKLHDRNYPSIGCAPCTRAIKDNEDVRAGRWWWENPEHKECGLHKR